MGHNCLPKNLKTGTKTLPQKDWQSSLIKKNNSKRERA